MARELDKILDTVNTGLLKDRMDFSDITAVLLYEFGLHRDDAYYLSKCSTTIPDSVLEEQAKKYFQLPRIKELIGMLRPFTDERKESKASSDGYMPNWKDVEVDTLTAAELEKMGTVMIRSMAASTETNPKDINDTMKMLDAIGALPKKQKDEKDMKQVIINPVFNSICPNCNHEVYINHAMPDKVDVEIKHTDEPVVEKKAKKGKKDKIVDIVDSHELPPND